MEKKMFTICLLVLFVGFPVFVMAAPGDKTTLRDNNIVGEMEDGAAFLGNKAHHNEVKAAGGDIIELDADIKNSFNQDNSVKFNGAIKISGEGGKGGNADADAKAKADADAKASAIGVKGDVKTGNIHIEGDTFEVPTTAVQPGSSEQLRDAPEKDEAFFANALGMTIKELNSMGLTLDVAKNLSEGGKFEYAKVKFANKKGYSIYDGSFTLFYKETGRPCLEEYSVIGSGNGSGKARTLSLELITELIEQAVKGGAQAGYIEIGMNTTHEGKAFGIGGGHVDAGGSYATSSIINANQASLSKDGKPGVILTLYMKTADIPLAQKKNFFQWVFSGFQEDKYVSQTPLAEETSVAKEAESKIDESMPVSQLDIECLAEQWCCLEIAA